MAFFIRPHGANNQVIPGSGKGWAIIRHRRPWTNSQWTTLAAGSAAYPMVKYWTLTKPGKSEPIGVILNPHFVESSQ